MLVCLKCKKEMTCLQVGVRLIFGKDWAYAGDKFGCTKCGTEIVSTGNAQGYRLENPKTMPDSIFMPEGS